MGTWIAEYSDRAVVINLANADAVAWLPRINRVAKRHSLTTYADV